MIYRRKKLSKQTKNLNKQHFHIYKFFLKGWIVCSKFVDYFRFNSQHNWRDLYDHFRKKKFFTLIKCKTFILSPKLIPRKVAIMPPFGVSNQFIPRLRFALVTNPKCPKSQPQMYIWCTLTNVTGIWRVYDKYKTQHWFILITCWIS